MAQVQPPRQINSDGTVTVRCRECGKDICRMIYRGFLSSVCEECSTGRVSPYSNLPEPMDHAPLYNTVEEDADPEHERIGLVQYIFRAIGFGRAKSDAPGPQSEATAKRKKRRGLFAEPDEED